MNLAAQITDRLTMTDVFEHYGFTANRSGFIICPIHGEKTASLKAYANDKRWKCFGCGAGGSVIDFVMQVFSLNFKQALKQIDVDFGLNLFEKPTLAEYRKRKRAVEAKQKTLQKQRMVKEQNFNHYLDLLSEWLKLDGLIEKYRYPSTDTWTDDLSDAISRKFFVELELDSLDFNEMGVVRCRK